MKKLSCKQVRRIIDSGRPESWPEEVRASVEAHVRECSACRRELALTQAISHAVAAGPRVKAPAGFSARLMQRIAEKEQRKAARRAMVPWGMVWSWRGAVAAVAVVAVVVVAAVVLQHGGPLGQHGVAVGTGGSGPAVVDAGTQVASVSDADLLKDLVMYHQHLEIAELGGDAGLLLAANGY